MVPRPIDILDNDAFSQEQDLSARRAAGILDTFVTGTPQDDGLTDEYFLPTVEAEILVADSLGIEEFRPTGDVYDDFYHQAD